MQFYLFLLIKRNTSQGFLIKYFYRQRFNIQGYFLNIVLHLTSVRKKRANLYLFTIYYIYKVYEGQQMLIYLT